MKSGQTGKSTHGSNFQASLPGRVLGSSAVLSIKKKVEPIAEVILIRRAYF